MEKTKNGGKDSLFFSIGNRLEVVESILGQFRSLAPVAVLSGEAGSGKTSVCYAVEKHMLVTHRVIFFDSAPQSFGDFITLLADKLKCNVEAMSGADDTKTKLDYCLETLVQSPEKVLFICDDAEEIYLATLERILKFISRCKENGIDTQLLLVGTPSVLAAYQGLAINDVANVEVSLFVLEPLSKDESGLFYEQLLGRKIQEGGEAHLSAEVLEMLYCKTEGNMKKISRIASKFAQTDESEASFFSLLSEIEGEERVHSKKMKRQVATQRKQQKAKNRARLVVLSWVLGFVVIVACGLFYFGQQPEVKTVVAALEQQPEEKHNIQDIKKEVVVQSPTVPTSGGQTPAVTVVVPESTPALNVQQGTTPPPVATSDLAVVVPTPIEKKDAVEKKGQADLVAVKEVITPPVQVVIQGEVVSAPVKEASNAVVKNTIVAVPTPKITPKIAQEPKKQVVETVVVEEKTNLLKPQQKIIVAPVTSPLPNKPTAEQLYTQSLAAGESWKNRDSGMFYTLQLMVLTSDSASEHLQNYLNQDEYRAVVDNVHVLKRNQGGSALLVFYGEYVSAEQARAGRDSLPAFLQKHKPYLITIDGALEKAGL